MELRHLRYFLALAEHLSFTEAARSVHVTQSTLSHQIRQLEEELAQTLFIRNNQRVVKTPAGEILLASVTRAMAELDHGLAMLRDVSSNLTGSLRIATTHTFNISLIPECVAKFIKQYPGMTVSVEELVAQELSETVLNGNVELGIGHQPRKANALAFESLFNEELVLIVGAAHPFADRKRVRMSELHRAEMVLPPAHYQLRKILDDALAAAGAQPQVIAEIGSVSPMAALVQQTSLASIVSSRAVQASDQLRVLRLISPVPVRTSGLLWRKDVQRSIAAVSFAAIVRSTAAQ